MPVFSCLPHSLNSWWFSRLPCTIEFGCLMYSLKMLFFFWFSLWPEGNTKYRTVRTVNSRAEFIINSSAVHFTQSIEIAFGSQPPKELVWLSKLTIGRASHVAGGGAETEHSGVLFYLGAPRDQWRTRTLWTVWACWVSSPFVVCLSLRGPVYTHGPPGACLRHLLLSILNCLKAVWVWAKERKEVHSVLV